MTHEDTLTKMMGSDVTFESYYEYAMIDQNDGSVVRGPSRHRDDLFGGLTQKVWELKGYRAWFYLSDDTQKYPMVCCRRPVHVYKGDWS